MSLRSRLGADTGVTVVEYAMLVALILVVSLGAISALEDRADDQAEASEDRVGDPGDAAFYPGGTTGGTTGGSTTGGSTPPPASLAVTSVTADPDPTQANPTSKWDAYATIRVEDGSTPVVGVIVTGTWVVDGTGQSEEVTCPTGATGECQVQFNGVGDNRKTVTFTVTRLEKDTTVVTPSGASVTVDCTTVTPAIC